MLVLAGLSRLSRTLEMSYFVNEQVLATTGIVAYLRPANEAKRIIAIMIRRKTSYFAAVHSLIY